MLGRNGVGKTTLLKSIMGVLRQSGGQVTLGGRDLSPLPANLGEVLKAYDKVIIPEMNLGQLAHVIRAKYLIDAVPFNQVSGLPFTA